MMTNRVFVILMLLWIASYFATFTSDAYEWKTYTVGDGLKDNTVYAVAVDNQTGTAWFATQNGTSSFDGFHWKSYLDGRDVRAILIEETNKIWFGTDQGVFLKEGESFTHFLPDLFIQDIALDQQGVKWFATRTGLYSTLDGSRWEDYHHREASLVETVMSLPQLAYELPRLAYELSKDEIKVSELQWARTSITSIAIKRNDVKCLATNVIFKYDGYRVVVRGIVFWDNVKGEFARIPLEVDWSDKDPIENDRRVKIITSIDLNDKDNLWYSVRGEGVFFFDDQKIHHYLSQDINQDGRWFGIQSPVTVQDLDGDGRQEVVAVAETGYDQQPRGIYVYDLMSGEKRWHYRVGPHVGTGMVAVGNVAGDGCPEIVLGGTSPDNGSKANGTDDAHGFMFILRNGKNLWGNGQSEPLTPPYGEIYRIALADLDKDGLSDVIGFISTNTQYANDEEKNKRNDKNRNWGGIIVTDGSGKQKAKIDHNRPIWHGGVADLNNDGFLEIVAIDDKGLLMIYDHKLSLLHRQQFEVGTRLSAIADLYGDGLPEILLLATGRFTVLDSQWTKGELATLWEYRGFPGNADVILSDIEPSGAAEILIIEGGRVHVLSYDTDQNFSLKHKDTGRRYGTFYSLLRTGVYPHAPSLALAPKPFTLKHVFARQDLGGLFTADVNGDGQLELISTKDNTITVWEYNHSNLWQKEYENERGDIRLTALEDDVVDNTVMLASRFRAGRPELLIIDAKNGAIIKSIEAEAGVTDELRNNYVNKIKVDKNSREVWFATDGGVSQFDGKQWQGFSTTDGLADRKVNDIAFDASHNIWFATEAGVSRLNRTMVEKAALKAPPTILLRDDKGVIWCATLGDGIRRYQADGEEPYLPTVAEGFYEVTACAVDYKRNVLWASAWNGGSDQGLYRINLDTKEIEAQLTFENSGLISNKVTAMVLDPRDGSLWLGASPHRSIKPSKRYSGINRYNPEAQTWQSWSYNVPDTQNPDTFTPNELHIPQSVTSLLLTDDAILWIGTYDEGVRRFDTTADGKDAWTVFTTKDGLASNRITAIAADTDGNLWFATPLGAIRYNEKTGKWQTFTADDGLAGNDVRDIKTAVNFVYFATNGGVSKYNGNNWRTHNTTTGLASNSVLSIAIDGQNTLWIGTSDKKVYARRSEATPPDTFITAINSKGLDKITPDSINGVAGVVFEFTGGDLGTDSDNLSFQYKLFPKEVSWSKYTRDQKKSYENLDDGTYTFYVRAVDLADNVDSTPASWTFTIDTIRRQLQKEFKKSGYITLPQKELLKLAYFITPNDEVIEYWVSQHIPSVPDDASEKAKTVFEKLKELGFASLPQTSYEVLPPMELLKYKAGNLYECALLYTTILEHLKTRTMLALTEKDAIVLFEVSHSSIAPQGQELLRLNDQRWMPLHVQFDISFDAACQLGFSNYKNWPQSEMTLLDVQKEQQRYQPMQFNQTAPISLERGVILAQQRQYDAAMREFNKVLEMQENSAATLNNLGNTYALKAYDALRAGKIQEAKRYFEVAKKYYRSASEAEAKDSAIFLNLGVTLYLQDKAEEALKTFKSAVHNGGLNFQTACYYLGIDPEDNHCETLKQLLSEAAGERLLSVSVRKGDLPDEISLYWK